MADIDTALPRPASGAAGPRREEVAAKAARPSLLAAMIESSEDAIMAADLGGIITSWNPAAEKMYGYSTEEIIGKPAALILPRDRTDEMSSILGEIQANGDLRSYETLRVRKDGAPVLVSLTAFPLHDKDGVIVGTSSIARDVTERDRAHNRALASSEYARNLIEARQDLLVMIDTAGKITDVNEGTIRVTGVARDELIGSHFSDYFTEPDKAREVYQRVFADGSVTDYPLTICHRDGSSTILLYSASVYRDEGGTVLGAVAGARDVTEQMQASVYARSLIEASLDPLVTICVEGKITDVNEATIKVTGVARDELIGTHFSDYFTEPDKAREAYRHVFADGSVTDYPLTICHQDGTATDVLYIASVYRDAGGNVLGVVAAARDVTEQKHIQAQLAKQQESELERIEELERFQRLTIGRELKMVELKREIKILRSLLTVNGGEPDDEN